MSYFRIHQDIRFICYPDFLLLGEIERDLHCLVWLPCYLRNLICKRSIEYDAPTTWRYLQDNADALAKRGSSIYKNRPLFSIFGVGHYTFTPWKVAISGFYKKVVFTAIRSVDGRPAVFDDTVYFLSCGSEDEAVFLTEILNSSIATEFLSSMIFWSDKRPITIDLLKRLNIAALARELGRENEYIAYIQQIPERRTKIPQRRRVKVSTNC